MAIQLITNPDGFLERKVGQAHMRLEIVLVLLVGAMSVPGLLYVVLQVLEEEGGAEMRIIAASRVIRPLLIMLVLWVVYSYLMHFISSYYGGRNPPSQVFKGAAWAFIPIGLGNLVKSGAMYLVFRGADIEAEMSGISPTEKMQSVLDSSMSEPLMLVAILVFAATILWSGHLLSLVVMHSKNLSRDEARRVAAVPVGLHLLVVLWAVVQQGINFGVLLSLT